MAAPETREVESFLQTPRLLSVVDGLGGHFGGGRAAEILVRHLAEGEKRFGPLLDLETDRRLLLEILNEAREEMHSEFLRSPDLRDMGATLAGLLLRGRSALAFNCGDCRVYRFSRGEAEKLTHDHSVVQVLVDQGEITEEEMRLHPRKNVVTSAVTLADEAFELTLKAVSRTEGDDFFLCSDGVWETLSLEELTYRLNDPDPGVEDRLFQRLLAAGCRDNVSFIRVS
jgi:protein phosphatase